MSKRVLIVEDEALIAMSLAQDLEDLGYTIAGLCISVAQALDTLNKQSVDIAVLDMRLGKETSEPIAAHLLEAGTPFIVTTGYSDDRMTGPFEGAQRVSKPYNVQDLIDLFPTA